MSNDKPKNPALAEALAKVKAESQTVIQNEQTGWMEQLSDFDWKHIPPHQMAVVLTKKPFRGKNNNTEFLTAAQALFFAMRCFELGLSPLSSEVWFNKDQWTVNVTTEGKRKLARMTGMDLGPPQYQRIERDFPKGKSVTGFEKDIGYVCTMTAGVKGEGSYTAWLSEWYVGYSLVWREKPEHMLQVRAQEKCITFLTGVGISEMPDERELADSDAKTEVPEIKTQAVEVVPFDSNRQEEK
jgi:hypothetical protein